jgi:hypothetical protein
VISARKHIAIILLGMFIFPVVFQQFHIIRHHSHDQGAGILVINQDSPDCTKVSCQRKDCHCPLCEYKFSIINMPDVFFFNAAINIIEGIEAESASSRPLQIPFSSASPRAPPL